MRGIIGGYPLLSGSVQASSSCSLRALFRTDHHRSSCSFFLTSSPPFYYYSGFFPHSIYFRLLSRSIIKGHPTQPYFIRWVASTSPSPIYSNLCLKIELTNMSINSVKMDALMLLQNILLTMRKFQQWQDNQIYFMHLSNLSVIRSRKAPSSVNIKKRQYRQNRSLSQQEIDKANSRMVKRIQNPKRIAIVSNSDYFKPTFSKEKYRIYAKNLNHQNLLFGKRLLEAESVISTSKLEKEYEIRKCSKTPVKMQSNSSWSLRSTKLKEFLKNDQPSLFLRGYGKHLLRLRIHEYEFHKLKLQYDQFHSISLILQFGRSVRQSEIVGIQKLTEHQFCFKFSKRPGFDGSIRAYIRYHNGIEDIELGYFNLSIKYYLEGSAPPEREQEQMYKRVGSYAGRIVFSTTARKSESQYQ